MSECKKFYDFKCHGCGMQRVDFLMSSDRALAYPEDPVVCECGEVMELQFWKTGVRHRPFIPYWDEHISRDGPVYITSPWQRRRLMKANNLEFKEKDPALKRSDWRTKNAEIQAINDVVLRQEREYLDGRSESSRSSG